MSNDVVLEIDRVDISYPTAGLRRRTTVVHGVSAQVRAGETVALVGESGSGKSTLAKAVLRLLRTDAGRILIHNEDWAKLGRSALRRARRHAQMVFQDPYSSLNPSMTVGAALSEPLTLHQGLRGSAREAAVADLLERVGLSESAARRYPAEFSGGQRQRIAIARALAAEPSLLVCDEAVSALDVSTQNQIVNLLRDLQRASALGILFITHDLALVRHVADRVSVMYLGRIMEEGPADRVFLSPANPYSVSLLAAMPEPDPTLAGARPRVRLEGDLPDPSSPPPGCPFQTRCPAVADVCRSELPGMIPVDGGGWSRCHFDAQEVAVRLDRGSDGGGDVERELA